MGDPKYNFQGRESTTQAPVRSDPVDDPLIPVQDEPSTTADVRLFHGILQAIYDRLKAIEEKIHSHLFPEKQPTPADEPAPAPSETGDGSSV